MSSHINWLNVQAGQFKVYFDRSQVNSTAAMQFASRAYVSDAFTAGGINRRDVGITIMNDEEVYPINYYFGVFNGVGPLVNRFAQFSSQEPTNGCPGGQTSGAAISYNGHLSRKSAEPERQSPKQCQPAHVCGKTPGEYHGSGRLWGGRYRLFGDAPDGRRRRICL